MELETNKKNSKGNQILKELFDENSMEEIDTFFKYENIEPGIICGFGKIKGAPAYAFAQDLDLSGGMMSKSQAFKLIRLYSQAVKTGNPILGIFNSKGASLEDKNQALGAYAKISKECCRLSGVVPQISIVTGTCLGAMASIVCCSDIVIMTKNGNLGANTGGENSGAESAYLQGTADIIAEDEHEAIQKAKKLITIIPSNNLCGNKTVSFSEPKNSSVLNLNKKDKYELINAIFDYKSFIELKQDFGKHFIIGLASIRGRTCGIICSNPAVLKSADYDSCSKVAKFIMFCDSFSIPLITLADTQKFSCAKGASKLCCAYSNSTTVKICVVTGEIYSGNSYISLCNNETQDLVICWDISSISALNPQTAVEILWKDKLKGNGLDFKDKRGRLVKEYMKTEANAFKACENGFANDVISPNETRNKLNLALEFLENKRERNLPKKHANINI